MTLRVTETQPCASTDAGALDDVACAAAATDATAAAVTAGTAASECRCS